jgi:hypothetical protein
MCLRHGLTMALCIFSTLMLAAQQPMREGNWEITMQMQIPNMPAPMPETKVTQCVTAEQLKDPASALPGVLGNNESCKMTDYKVSGSTVTWAMACSAPQVMTGSGELTFVGDTYTGTVTMNTGQGDLAVKTAGKRLGDCVK